MVGRNFNIKEKLRKTELGYQLAPLIGIALINKSYNNKKMRLIKQLRYSRENKWMIGCKGSIIDIKF